MSARQVAKAVVVAAGGSVGVGVAVGPLADAAAHLAGEALAADGPLFALAVVSIFATAALAGALS